MQGRCSAEVAAVRCDSALQEELAALTGRLARSRGCPGIAGIVNSGGVLSDAILSAQTAGVICWAGTNSFCNPLHVFRTTSQVV